MPEASRAMRRTFLVLVLALVALAPATLADSSTGTGTGATVFGQSAGVWTRVDVQSPGVGPRVVYLNLTWDNLPRADFDVTVWKPGAFADGRLEQAEIVKAAWTPSQFPPERLEVTLAGGSWYHVTVEPMIAVNNHWSLSSSPNAGLVESSQLVLGTKFTR